MHATLVINANKKRRKWAVDMRGLDLRGPYRRLYRWAAHRLYDEGARIYDGVAWLVSLGRWDAWRRQVLDHVVGQRVLEIGFGTGALLMAGAERAGSLWGVDPSSAMQSVTGRKLRRYNLQVPRIQARAQSLPFPDGLFSTVLSTFPAEYIVDPATLREVARVLRPSDAQGSGGRFVITGIGFRARRAPVRDILRLVFGGSTEDSVTWYRDFAASAGFAVTVVDDEAEPVRVPVLILEKQP
jgi:SAM-dependent methyltransferase